MLFIQATNLVVWDTIIDSSLVPPRNQKDWTNEDNMLAQLNAKAMHILFCSLGPEEYSRVSSCYNDKEISEKLEVNHEGTSQVKKSNINILTLNYENLKMKPDEDIKTMSNQFTTIINNLMNFGKVYPNKDMVRKMLTSYYIMGRQSKCHRRSQGFGFIHPR
ncbi:uncharacterized protein LOC120176224 [Hibiscus syriacus]|uniref:uncharacterized protein LOC120176224 n=1 Tax=Hibiscus syriacus TaxID=106335 RepID=UPI0019209654|nr:uncharacterized protein LOC120176224 [Hibiscus syriacus]